MSKQNISDKSGINYQKLNKVLSGHTKTIDSVMIWKLVENLDLNPLWFFKDIGPKKLSELKIVDEEEQSATNKRLDAMQAQIDEIVEMVKKLDIP